MFRATGAFAASVAASSAHLVAAGMSEGSCEPRPAVASSASRAGLRNYSKSAANSTRTRSVFHAS